VEPTGRYQKPVEDKVKKQNRKEYERWKGFGYIIKKKIGNSQGYGQIK
jgi:hypothetical protein